MQTDNSPTENDTAPIILLLHDRLIRPPKPIATPANNDLLNILVSCIILNSKDY